MTTNRLHFLRRLAVGGFALVTASTLFLLVARARVAPVSTPSDPAGLIARGEYLVMVGGCNDCHTPWIEGPEGPMPDQSRTLSGHPHDFPLREMPSADPATWGMTAAATNTAFAGPWGVSFAANLTPCEDTGIGVWSEDIFINTLRTGRHWGQSRPILPPMPWFNYGKMTEEDLRAVFAYLRTLPARHNSVPLPLPPSGVVETDETW